MSKNWSIFFKINVKVTKDIQKHNDTITTCTSHRFFTIFITIYNFQQLQNMKDGILPKGFLLEGFLSAKKISLQVIEKLF